MILIYIVFGYLIGNILPAYYLGRLKGIDIRNEGAEYAGTINVFHVLGLKYALVTGIIDLFKGVFAIRMAQAFGADFAMAQLAGIAAIAGHVLPFYLGFRGGQGVACATGILLYYLMHFLQIGAIPFTSLIYFAVIVAVFAYISHEGEIISQIILPLLVLTSIHNSPDDVHNVFLVIIAIYIMAVGIYNIVTRKLIKLQDEDFTRYRWRVLLRPFALLFIFIYLIYGKTAALVVILSLLFISFMLDVDRIFGGSRISKIFFKELSFSKPKEQRRFSSITTFLFSCALILWIFHPVIAFVSILLLIFGDMFAKIFGIAFKRHSFLKKSLEGSLAFWGCGLICAYILNLFFDYNLTLVLIGTVAAVFGEALTDKIDDNLTITIFSAIAMWIANWFGVALLIQ